AFPTHRWDRLACRCRATRRGTSPARLEAVAEEAATEGVEFKFSEEGAQSRFVARADAEDFRLERKRHVDVNGRKAFGEEGLVAEFFERFLELALLLGGVVESIFQ